MTPFTNVPFRFAAALLALCTLAAACGHKTVAQAPPELGVTNAVFLASQAEIAAMAVDSQNGDFFFANRTSGDIFEISKPYGSSAPKTIGHIDVSTDGQRGLLGLAVDSSHRLFVGYTASTAPQNVTVATLVNGSSSVVWTGPPSASLANGGHLAFSPHGRLTIGIGDLTDRSKLTDPNSPNGKLLSLNPNGPATQTPTVVSADWNNPFAFTYDYNGALWVGDNEPGDASERLARADINKEPTHITHIGAHQVASGLASDVNALWECTYLGHKLQGYLIDDKGVPQVFGQPVATDCSLGVVALSDSELVYSTGSELREVNFRNPPDASKAS